MTIDAITESNGLWGRFKTGTSGTGKGAADGPDGANAALQPYPLNHWFQEAYVDGSEKLLPKDEKTVKGPRVRIAQSGVAVEGVEVGKGVTLVFKVPKEQRNNFKPTGLQVQAVIPNYYSNQAVTGLVYKQIPAEQVQVGDLKYTPASGEIRVKVTVKTYPGESFVLRLRGNSFATLKPDAPQGAPAPVPTEAGGNGPKPAATQDGDKGKKADETPAAGADKKKKEPAKKEEKPASADGDEWGAPIK